MTKYDQTFYGKKLNFIKYTSLLKQSAVGKNKRFSLNLAVKKTGALLVMHQNIFKSRVAWIVSNSFAFFFFSLSQHLKKVIGLKVLQHFRKWILQYSTNFLIQRTPEVSKHFTWVNCWTKVHCNDKCWMRVFFSEHLTGERNHKLIVLKYRGGEKNY